MFAEVVSAVSCPGLQTMSVVTSRISAHRFPEPENLTYSHSIVAGGFPEMS